MVVATDATTRHAQAVTFRGLPWGGRRYAPFEARREGWTRAELAERLLDADTDAIFVVAGDCRLQMLNGAAAELLAGGGPLAVRNGRLGPSGGEASADAAAEFRHAVAEACSDPDAGGALSCRMPAPRSLALRGDTGLVRILIDSLDGGEERLACLRLRDFEARLKRSLQIACEAYALTPAECALAGSLMRGLAPAEHAVQRGIRMPTVRSQLASIYAKAGVAGHAELVIALWLWGS
jgi:DNA-binding CsgD family transcriptional regulator